MKVYRIENENGTGPYLANPNSCYFEIDTKNSRYEPYDRQPAPHEDGIRGMTADEICGFESLRKVTEWFDRENLVHQALEGYRISIYEAEDEFVRKGFSQLVFDRRYARKISHVPLRFAHRQGTFKVTEDWVINAETTRERLEALSRSEVSF